MKIKSIFFLLADTVVQDDQSKKISLINIFDQLNTKKLPSLIPPFFLVSQFIVEDLKSKKDNVPYINYKFTITEPGSDEISLGNGKISIAQDKKLGAIMKVNGFVFKKTGDHLFKFIVDSKTVAEFNLTVHPD